MGSCSWTPSFLWLHPLQLSGVPFLGSSARNMRLCLPSVLSSLLWLIYLQDKVVRRKRERSNRNPPTLAAAPLWPFFLDAHSAEKDLSSLGVLDACLAAITAVTHPSNFETGACLRVGHFFYSLCSQRAPFPGLSSRRKSFIWSFLCSHLLCDSGVWATWVSAGKYTREK